MRSWGEPKPPLLRRDTGDCEKRRHVRSRWEKTLTLWIQEQHGTQRCITATAYDLSRGGFSFMFSQYIYPGSVVRAWIEGLPRRPVLSGVVLDCVHLTGCEHSISVQFVRNVLDDLRKIPLPA